MVPRSPLIVERPLKLEETKKKHICTMKPHFKLNKILQAYMLSFQKWFY